MNTTQVSTPSLQSAHRLAWILKALQTGQATLPVMSPLHNQITKLRMDPELSSDAVLKVIEMEPAVAARVIQLCNSAFYYTPWRPITDLRVALVRLGNRVVSNIIDTVVLGNFMRHTSYKVNVLLHQMWRNTLYTAIASREIARETRCCDPETAMLAGMFHNIGEPLLVRLLCNDAPQAADSFHPGSPVLRLIREHHGYVGGLFLERWGFPQSLVELAWTHHGALGSPMHAAVQLANQMALRFGYTYLEAEPDDAAFEAAAGAFTRLDAADMAEIETTVVDMLTSSLAVVD